MDESDVSKKREELSKIYPHFPDGRINYKDTNYAPVVTVFVMFAGEILLVKRSDKVGTYKGKWNAIAGYIDDKEPIRQKALGEVREETGITGPIIRKVIAGTPYELEDKGIGKTWLICPFIVELNSKPEIKLDFEGTEYKWIKPEQITEFDRVFGLERSYAACLPVS